MECMNENCDNELVGRQKTYCSDKCRMAQSRTDKPEQTKVEHFPPDDELFAGLPAPLRTYANGELGGDWYRRLIHHLKTTPIERLKTEEKVRDLAFIPCWRYEMEKQCATA